MSKLHWERVNLLQTKKVEHLSSLHVFGAVSAPQLTAEPHLGDRVLIVPSAVLMLQWATGDGSASRFKRQSASCSRLCWPLRAPIAGVSR
jgi:hypothetical protein